MYHQKQIIMKTTITPTEIKDLIMNIVLKHTEIDAENEEILNNSLYEFFKDFEISVKHPKLNKLPENWAVKNDGSQLFKDTVLKYLKDQYDLNWNGTDKEAFYGIKNKSGFCGLLADTNNITLLTIGQFIDKIN